FSRVGHLAIEVDCFLKEGRVRRRPRYRGVIICPTHVAANRCLLSYFARHLRVISSPWLCGLAAPLRSLPSLQYSSYSYCTAMYETASYAAIQAANAHLPPLLTLTPDHAEAGRKRLRELGVPEGAWFVCIHGREAGFEGHAPVHDARNVRIGSYTLAMQAIVA